MTFTELGEQKVSSPGGCCWGARVPGKHLLPQRNLKGVSSHICPPLLHTHEGLHRLVTRKPTATTAKICPKPDFCWEGDVPLTQRQRGAITRVTRVKESHEERHLVSAQLGCQTSLLLMFLFLIFLLAFGVQTSSS